MKWHQQYLKIYTDNKVGALNFSIVSVYPKILSIMSVRATAALGLSFLAEKKKLLFFLYSNRNLDSTIDMTDLLSFYKEIN